MQDNDRRLRPHGGHPLHRHRRGRAQGAAANLIGGARIVVDTTTRALGSTTTDEQLQALFLKNRAPADVAYLSQDDAL